MLVNKLDMTNIHLICRLTPELLSDDIKKKPLHMMLWMLAIKMIGETPLP